MFQEKSESQRQRFTANNETCDNMIQDQDLTGKLPVKVFEVYLASYEEIAYLFENSHGLLQS